MSRPRGVNTTPVSFSLNKEVIDRLNKYSKESMIPKSKILEKSLIEYMDKKGAYNGIER